VFSVAVDLPLCPISGGDTVEVSTEDVLGYANHVCENILDCPFGTMGNCLVGLSLSLARKHQRDALMQLEIGDAGIGR
jgi:hypothetical protein